MKRRDHLTLALVFSVLLHLFLLLLGVAFSVLVPPEVAKKEDEPVEVTVLPPGVQIADVAPPEKEETPDKARFVGLYDSKVKEETVSPSRSPAGGTPSGAPEKKRIEKKEKASAEEGTKLAAKRPETSPPKREKSAWAGEEDYFQGGVSEDYFPDYKLGEHTYLNILKYPKVGYFVRLKKAFRTTFNPVPALRANLTRVSHGQIDVVLAVTVDRMGKLAGLQILRSSGLAAYDQEAVRTVRDSAPFAVPPGELLDKTSMLRMAWTFTVYL